MNLNPTWNRRTFLTSLGLTTAAASLPAATLTESARPAARASISVSNTFAFVSVVNVHQGGARTINTYRIEGGRWTEILYPFDTFYPNTLAVHPTLPVLYTASIPQHGPRGNARRGRATAISIDDASFISVETTIDRGRHWLNELGSQPLALAATRPRQIAVSPDGQYLLVADTDGGHYNLLPIAADGSLLPVEHVLKQTGSGPHPWQTGPRPHSVLFHPSARLAYTTDLGTDHLNLLSLEQKQPRISDRISFTPGSGPADLTLHPSGSFLLVTNRLRPALSLVALHPETGALSSAVTHFALPGNGWAGPAAINAAGTIVYAISSVAAPASALILSTLRLSRSGRLTSLSQKRLPHLLQVATLAIHGPDLLAIGDGGIVTLPLDDRTGLPGAPSHVVTSGDMTGIVLRSA